MRFSHLRGGRVGALVKAMAIGSVFLLLLSSAGQALQSASIDSASGAKTSDAGGGTQELPRSKWDFRVMELANKSGGFDYYGATQSYAAFFGGSAGNGSRPTMQIVAGNYSVGYAPTTMVEKDEESDDPADATTGIANVTASRDGAKIGYSSAYGEGVNLEYKVGWNGIKESYILANPPAKHGDLVLHGTLFYDSANLLVFADGGQVRDTASTNGSVEFRDSLGEPIFVIPKGWAHDSATIAVPGDPGSLRSVSSWHWEGVTYALKRYGSITFFDIIVPAEFLFDPETTYPVEIDPSIGPYVITYEEYNNEEIEQTSDITVLGGGTLVLRNSTLTWQGDYHLTVDPGGALVLDNTTMTAVPSAGYQVDVHGSAKLINTLVTGRHPSLNIDPASTAEFLSLNTEIAGSEADCLQIGTDVNPLRIEGSALHGCMNAGLLMMAGPQQGDTWAVTNSRFNDSHDGVVLSGDDFSDATFDALTFESNRVGGMTVFDATASVTDCDALRNARGWAVLEGGVLTVTDCTAEGNVVGAYAEASTLTLQGLEVTNSSVWDVYCRDFSTCDISGGNNGDWVTESQNSEMTFRHQLKLRIVDGAAQPLVYYRVYIEDRYGNPAANESATNATGWVNLTVSDRRIQPDDSLTFYTPHKIHLGSNPEHNLTTVIDADWNLTLYATGDADNDTIPDLLEDVSDAYWFEAANHAYGSTQVNTSVPTLGRAIQRRGVDGLFLKEDSFPDVPAGTYQISFEAWTNTTGANLSLAVKDEAEASLLDATPFALNASHAWYVSPNLTLSAPGRLRLTLTDDAELPVGSILVGSIVVVRGADDTPENTSARPGQVTSPISADSDTDGASDATERRNQTFWWEAENVALPSSARVTEGNASSGAAAEHPAGSAGVVDLGVDGLSPFHVYELWIRARTPVQGSGARLQFGLVAGATVHLTNLSLGSDYRWLKGPTFTADTSGRMSIIATDLDDPNLSDSAAWARVDAILLADLNNSNPLNLSSNPLQRDTDLDGALDGPELWGFFTADFVNATEGNLSTSTTIWQDRVRFDSADDWVNVSVPIRYNGSYRFQILPAIYAADAGAPGRLDVLEKVLNATLSAANNTDVVAIVDFPNVYFGSDSPPTLYDMQQLEGWYSWVFPNLTVGTYHLKIWVNDSAAANLGWWGVLIDRIYVQKRTLDPLDSDFENDGVFDGLEIERSTFPLNPDSDYDHLTDYEEIYPAQDGWMTDPLARDTDGDGLPDAVEDGFFGDADNGTTTTNPTAFDTDGDGLPDGWVDGWSYDRAASQPAELYNPDPISMKDERRQPWEGEDLDLNGAVKSGAFAVDKGNYANSTGGETNASNRDSDNDGMPDGWELWVRDFNTTYYADWNDPLILNPLFNDSANDSDVDRGTFDGDPDGLTNLQEYLSRTSAFIPDSDNDAIRDGDEANVTLRTNISTGFVNSSHFADADAGSYVYFDKQPYDQAAGAVYWFAQMDTDVAENYPGSLFHGAQLIFTIPDGGAVLYNPDAEYDLIYVWQAGSEYAYTGGDSTHNGIVYVFAKNPAACCGESSPHAKRGFEGQEAFGGVNPLRRDSDSDGIVDGYDGPGELGSARWFDDRDNDGLVNALDRDSDNDSMADGLEAPAGGPEFDPSLGHTNAYDPDTDHDGIPDANDSLPADFDNDGLTGYGAFTDTWGSWDAFGGKEATYTVSGRTLLWNNPDTDGDGISDGSEDANHDGAWNNNETSALDLDTDDDGLWDGADVFYGTPTIVEAETASGNSSGVVMKTGAGSGNSYLEWTGYLENTTFTVSLNVGYYQLEMALADDGSPSNTSILGRNISVEVYLDGVFLTSTLVKINSSVHLSSIFYAVASPIPIWNTSSHTIGITVVRADEDYRFELDYLRFVPYHPGERNVSASALSADSDSDGLQDGAERALNASLVPGDNETRLGTNGSNFVARTSPALSSPAATDSDGDRLLDGTTRLVNSTVLQAESSTLRWNTLDYNNGGVVGVATNTQAGSGGDSWSSMGYTLFLERGYYRLVGNLSYSGDPNGCSTPTYRTNVVLQNVTVGRGIIAIPQNCPWVEALVGAFFVEAAGIYRLDVIEWYDSQYSSRFVVDRFILNLYDVGEYSVGTNPSDRDSDRDLMADGAEVFNLSNPLNLDTDGEGIPDAIEAPYGFDYDGDSNASQITGWLNATDAYDTDRDNDLWGDADVNESNVTFRTNASRGMYNESGVWIAVDINANGTLSTFVWSGPAAINASNTTKVVFRTRLGGNITRPAVTPEGYGLWVNGSSLYIDLPGSVDVRFAASSSGVPENATNLESNPFYMLALRESLNWSLMLNTDPDDDGLVGADDPCPYVFDCDSDGIGDGDERANKTNATNPDSDGDGLWDGPDATVGSAFHPGEWVNASNPLLNDTDHDGLFDGANITVGGVFHRGELNYSTDPTAWDTDGDGMADPWEIDSGLNALNATDGWLDKDNDGFNNTLEYRYQRPFGGWELENGTWWNGTNVSFWDSDGDGMPDGWEVQNATDPKSASDASTDTDGDGLTALQEYRLGRPGSWNEATQGVWWNGSKPGTNDTDGDGILDPDELNGGNYDPDGDGIRNWRDLDSDNDSLPDAYEGGGWYILITADAYWWSYTGNNEIANAWKLVFSDPYQQDTDEDGVGDLSEFLNRSDPTLGDTDHDGVGDLYDSNRTIPEWHRPWFTGGVSAGIKIRGDVDCAGASFCEQHKGDNLGSLLQLFACIFCTAVSAARATYWLNVTVTVEDDAGLQNITIYAWKMGRSESYLIPHESTTTLVSTNFSFAMTLSEAANIAVLEMFQVVVSDRNGNAIVGTARAGLLWDSQLYEQHRPAIKNFVDIRDGFRWGLFQGLKEGLFMTGVAMGTGGFNLLENVVTLGKVGQAGKVFWEFMQMLWQFDTNPYGLFKTMVYSTAMSDSIILNPFDGERNGADQAALDASSGENPMPLLNHLWNATKDSVCVGFYADKCHGPGNSTNWAKFMAGHAGTAAAVELAMFVIFATGMAIGVADYVGGARGGPTASLRGDIDAAARMVERARSAISGLRGEDVIGVPATEQAPAILQILDSNARAGVRVAPETQRAAAERVGDARAAQGTRVLLDPKYGSPNPLGTFRQGGPAGDGPWELKAADEPLFDAAARVTGRESPTAGRATFGNSRANPELLTDGALEGFKGRPSEAAAFGRNVRAGGGSPDLVKGLLTGDAHGQLSPSLESFRFQAGGKWFRVFRYVDNTRGDIGFLFEEGPSGELAPLGRIGDVDRGATYDVMNNWGLDVAEKGDASWYVENWLGVKIEAYDLAIAPDVRPVIGTTSMEYRMWNVEAGHNGGPDIVGARPGFPDEIRVIKFSGTTPMEKVGTGIHEFLKQGGEFDLTAGRVTIISGDFVDYVSNGLGLLERSPRPLPPNTPLPGAEGFIKGFGTSPRYSLDVAVDSQNPGSFGIRLTDQTTGTSVFLGFEYEPPPFH